MHHFLPTPNQWLSLQCSVFPKSEHLYLLSTWRSNALFLFICSDRLVHGARGLEVVSAQPASSSRRLDFPFGLHLGPWLGEQRSREEGACVLLLVGGRCSVSWGCPFSFFCLYFFASPASPLCPLGFVATEVISVGLLSVLKCCHSTLMNPFVPQWRMHSIAITLGGWVTGLQPILNQRSLRHICLVARWCQPHGFSWVSISCCCAGKISRKFHTSQCLRVSKCIILWLVTYTHPQVPTLLPITQLGVSGHRWHIWRPGFRLYETRVSKGEIHKRSRQKT